jgi:hypothetical protein
VYSPEQSYALYHMWLLFSSSHFYVVSQLCVSHIILCESTSQCFALLFCHFKKLQIGFQLVVSCSSLQNIPYDILFMGCYGYSDVWKFHSCLTFVIQYYSCSMMYTLLGTVPCFIHRILITSHYDHHSCRGFEVLVYTF